MEYEDEDQDLVDALLDIEEGLTEWEIEFAESLDRWLKENSALTEKQRQKAIQILEDKG